MSAIRKVSDMVREWLPQMRFQMSTLETNLAVHLRGNSTLMDALTALIKSRISGRVLIAEPSDPIACKSMLARDRELQWLLSRLEFIYRSPVNPTGEDREQLG